LPKSMEKLGSLTRLIISMNNFEKLPISITFAKRIPDLHVEKNLLSDAQLISDEAVNNYTKGCGNIKAKYFDDKINKYCSLDINNINNSRNVNCFYCKKNPVTSYSKQKYKNYLVCSQKCSDNIFHNFQ
jgi:hypothetical protein